MLIVSATLWTFNWPLMSLFTKRKVVLVPQKAHVSTEVLPFEMVIGTISKLLLHEFPVSTESALFDVPLLQLVSF